MVEYVPFTAAVICGIGRPLTDRIAAQLAARQIYATAITRYIISIYRTDDEIIC